MSIIAEIGNGDVLEFPDDTPDDVIEKAVIDHLSKPTQEISAEPKVDKGPSIGEQIVDEIPQTGGGMVGGVLGAQAATAAGMAGTVPGGALVLGGIGLGAGAGESYKQIGQHLSGDPKAPKTSIEAAKRIGRAATFEVGGELIGNAFLWPVKKGLAPFAPKVTEGAAELAAAFRNKIGPVVFTPAEMTESRVLDVMQNIGESSLLGGGRISDFKINRTEAFNDFADDLIDQFGRRVPTDELGDLFVASIDRKMEIHKEAANILYNQVDEMIGTEIKKVPVTKMVDTGLIGPGGEKMMKEVTTMELKEVPKVMIPSKGLKEFAEKYKFIVESLGSVEGKAAGDDLVAAIMDLPDEMGFTTAKELRSRLISRVNEFSVINKKAPAIGKAKRMIQIIDESITDSLKKFDATNASKGTRGKVKSEAAEEAEEIIASLQDDIERARAKGYSEDEISGFEEEIAEWQAIYDREVKQTGEPSPSAYDAWRIADKFYKQGQEKFNNTMIRRFVKMADESGVGGEMIAPKIFQPGKVSTVRKVKQAVDPPTWNKLQGFFVQNLFNKSTDSSGNIVGSKLINNIAGKPNSFGMPMMEEILSKEQIREIVNLGKALKLTQERQSEGAGKVFIQLTQAGAIMSLATGQFKTASATVILAPPVLSKIMLNPTGCKLLTTGMKLPQKSDYAAGVMSRLILMSQRLEEEDD